MVKVASPSRTSPNCSWGWWCSGTTAPGSSATLESIRRSPLATAIRTPGKRSRWGRVDQSTKYGSGISSTLQEGPGELRLIGIEGQARHRDPAEAHQVDVQEVQHDGQEEGDHRPRGEQEH